MRKLIIPLVLVAVFLGGCAATTPRYERDSTYAFVCFPGSAVRRPAPPGAYPDWMYLDKGTCKHR